SLSLAVIVPHAPPSRDSSSLPLHDALPTSGGEQVRERGAGHGSDTTQPGSGADGFGGCVRIRLMTAAPPPPPDELRIGVAASARSEEHTSELQSRENLVCRLLLEKKKHQNY